MWTQFFNRKPCREEDAGHQAGLWRHLGGSRIPQTSKTRPGSIRHPGRYDKFNRYHLLFSVVDPHWISCGSWSGSSFLTQCGSGSREPKQCGFIPVQTFKSQKVEFLQKNSDEVTKALFNSRKPGLFVNFVQLPWSWIRIRIPNTDPDPGQPNQCGSGYTTLLFILTCCLMSFNTRRYLVAVVCVY